MMQSDLGASDGNADEGGGARRLAHILSPFLRGPLEELSGSIDLAVAPPTACTFVYSTTGVAATPKVAPASDFSTAEYWIRSAHTLAIGSTSPASKIKAIRNDLTVFVCKSPLQRIPYPHSREDQYGNLLLFWRDSTKMTLCFDGSGSYYVLNEGVSPPRPVPSSRGIEARALKLLTSWENGPPRPGWVSSLEDLGPARPSTAVLSTLVDTIFDLMSEQRFGVLDRAYRDLDVARVSADALITMLRLTFSARFQITSWMSLLEKTRSQLDDRGIDSKLELVGLSSEPDAKQPV